MHVAIIKTKIYFLLSIDNEGEYFFQDMRGYYRIDLAARFIKINNLNNIININEDKILNKFNGIKNFNQKDIEIISFINSQNSEILCYQYHGKNHNNEWLNNFLNFFVDYCYIPYMGEFGTELACFIPFINKLKNDDLLKNRKIITYKGMEPYYFFLNTDEIIEISEKRNYVEPNFRIPLPNIDEHNSSKNELEYYSDYRSIFLLKAEKNNFLQMKNDQREIIFLQNKFTVEWSIGPINYFPIIFLQKFYEIFSHKFRIIYSRPGIKVSKDYSIDHNDFCDYPDEELANRYGIEILEQHFSDFNYNLIKMQILSLSKNYISVQGGGSYLLPKFHDSNIFMLHYKGDEEKGKAYDNSGFFTYFNNGTNNTKVFNSYENLWSELCQHFIN